MPTTAVESSICDICGADVRAGSQFCYNCGSSLRSSDSAESSKPESTAPVETSNGSAKSKSKVRGERRRRPIDRGPVEVVWEPGPGISGLYIAGALFILIVAAALFTAAMLLK